MHSVPDEFGGICLRHHDDRRFPQPQSCLHSDNSAFASIAAGRRRIPAGLRIRSRHRVDDMKSSRKLLRTAILALSLTLTTTVGLAADYEILAGFRDCGDRGRTIILSSASTTRTRSSITVPRPSTLKREHLTGECTERPGFPHSRTPVNGPNAQGGMSNIFGGICPCFGSWRSTKQRGKLNSVFQTLLGAWT